MARVLITGASTGLGLAAATELADGGHEVVLHVRRPERLEDRSLAERVHAVVHGDLARRDEVEALAEQAEAHGPFDAVIHNAGVMRGPDVFAVNVVAPFVLTARMSRPSRAIFLGSSMHRSGSTDIEAVDLDDASSRPRAYPDSKLWVAAMAMGLVARLDDDHGRVAVHVVDPGWVPTRMGGPSASDDLVEGHRTQAWLATAPDPEIDPATGGYWYHHAPRRPEPTVLDPAFQDRVLSVLEDHTGLVMRRHQPR